MRWLAAPGAALVALAASLALPEPHVAPFVFAPITIALAAWAGGRGPGLLAVLLIAAGGNYAAMEPRGAWSPGAAPVAASALFAVAGALLALVVAAFRTSARQAADRHRDADRLSRRLALAMKSGRSGWFDWDIARDRIEWSDELLALYGLAPDRFGGRYEHWLARVHPDDRAAADAAARGALDTGAFECEFRICRPDGEVRWLHGRGEVLAAPGRPARTLLGINVDVTDRRRAEAALGAARSQLETALASMPDAVVIADAAGAVLHCNEAFAAFHRWPAGAPCPATLDAYAGRIEFRTTDGAPVPPEAWPVARALRGERAANAVYRLRLPGGGAEWVGSHGYAPIRDDAGAITGAVVVARDVTEREAAREALRDSEARFRALADNIAQLVWMADAAGRVTWCNRRWCDYTGATVRHLADDRGHALHPGHRERVLRSLDRCLASGAVWEDTFPLRAADGTYRWFLWRAVPVRDEAGAVARWCGTGTDVTERRAAEEAAHQAGEELRALNAQLREADRRKSDFLAVLSHELRNPLAPIRNGVVVLERAVPGGEHARQALAVIDRQTAHLARLVDDLLDMSRIANGKVRLQTETASLNEIVQGTGDDFRGLLAQAGIAFDVSVPAEPLEMAVDRTRMAQVVGNLLHNAAKFTPPGGHVQLALRRDGAAHALVTVRDSGAGMEARIVERLFEPFVQAEETLARSGGGLGLGLALVRGLVELHGGTLAASSEGPGQGSLFAVRLPLVSRPRAPRPAAGTAPAATLRVLIVEDNYDAADSLRLVLTLAFGLADVRLAFTGHDGIQQARVARPDLVLCDLGLPGLDGYAVARALRADPATSGTVLVALSGYARPDDVERTREAGFDHHLAKPADIDALGAVLARASVAVGEGPA